MSTQDTNPFQTLPDWFSAAGSYFGIPVDQVLQGCDIRAARGCIELVLVVALTPKDMAGIAKRMQELASQNSEGVGGREVQHVDTEPNDTTGVPPHVWLNESELVGDQKLFALSEEKGRYAIAVGDLTAEQAQKHGHDILIAKGKAQS